MKERLITSTICFICVVTYGLYRLFSVACVPKCEQFLGVNRGPFIAVVCVFVVCWFMYENITQGKWD